jgi:hypothetical protein
LGQIQEARDKTIQEFQKNLEQQQQGPKPVDAGEKEPSFVSDVYSECYPASFEGTLILSAFFVLCFCRYLYFDILRIFRLLFFSLLVYSDIYF